MLKELMIATSLLLFSQVTLAETCPTVNEIKKNSLKSWKAYDSLDGKVLSSARETRFKNMIEEFALAEWKTTKPLKGTIHCYYRDKTGSSLEAYFAKNNFKPNNRKHFWYEVSGYMHCAAGMDKCEFNNQMMGRTQLARK